MRIIRTALVLLPLGVGPGVITASAAEFTRADVWVLVNREAHQWLLDADNFRLDVETLRLPLSEKDVGKVCGPIIPRTNRRSPDTKGSYSATLVIEKGELVVGGMSTFYMGVAELMSDGFCAR